MASARPPELIVGAAPRLDSYSGLRVADGALCDAAGVRRVLETYREYYAQQPSSEAIKLLLFYSRNMYGYKSEACAADASASGSSLRQLDMHPSITVITWSPPEEILGGGWGEVLKGLC